MRLSGSVFVSIYLSVYVAGEAAANDYDDESNDDDARATVDKRPRMRMYADDVTTHQHVTTRYVCVGVLVCLRVLSFILICM